MDGLSAGKPIPNIDGAAAPAWMLLEDSVRRFGDRPALNFFGRRTSYKKLARQVDAAAAGLQSLGAGPGMNIGICLPNTPYSVIIYFAILKTGATVANLNPLYTAHELSTQIKEADISIMVTIDVAVVLEKFIGLRAKGLLKAVIVCPMAAAMPMPIGVYYRLAKAKDIAPLPADAAFIPFDDLLDHGAAPKPVSIDPVLDIAVLQFTGGTTGTPKGAMLTHGNIVANVRQVLAMASDFDPGQERILGVLPLFHVFAMTAVMNLGLAIGAELLLIPKPEPKIIIQTIMRRRPTVLPGVPTLYTSISNTAEAAGITDMSFIKFCISGGAPIPAEVISRFERISHCHIVEGYGLSETSPVVALNPPAHTKLGSVGLAVPGTRLEIRDPEDPSRLMAQGERGEICVAGPQVMRGYYNRPAETADVTAPGGALRTGDIGYLDEDGYLFIVDRIKDLIICGGYNVYPRVIEEAAYEHQAVQDAIAIGIPDPYRGQAPKLFVTLRAGETTTPAELMTYLAGRLNKIEMPKLIEIRETLPKTMVGKLSKKELVAEEMAKKNAKTA